MSFSPSLEASVLGLLAERYREDGYDFIVYPGKELLPKRLQKFSPDAIALRDNEKIIIEVKASTSAPSDYLGEYAEIARKEGWQFQLISATDYPSDRQAHRISDFKRVRSYIDEIDELLQEGYYREAFVSYWFALEALTRLYQSRKSSENSMSFLSPLKVVGTLELFGIIGMRDAKSLRHYVKMRNQIVHGDLSIRVTGNEAARIKSITYKVLSEIAEVT